MKKLTYLFLALLIVACSSDDGNGGDEQSSCPIYLDSNGITIKACDDALVGDTGNINGFTYTIVSEQQLRDYIDADYPDLNRLVTSQVTNMQELFRYTATDINQPIGNWDVSNVTNMVGMFLQSEFNEDIGNWDVSNVTDMEEMFYDNYYFNQDISSWSVDNVTNCRDFSGEAPLTEENTPNFTNCTP